MNSCVQNLYFSNDSQLSLCSRYQLLWTRNAHLKSINQSINRRTAEQLIHHESGGGEHGPWIWLGQSTRRHELKSQIHVKHYNNWKSNSTQQGRQWCLRQAYYLTSPSCDLDLWPTDLKADRFTPLPVDHLCQFASNQFNHFQNIVLTSLVTDGCTDKLSNRLRTHCLRLPVWPDGDIMRADSFNKTTELAEDNVEPGTWY